MARGAVVLAYLGLLGILNGSTALRIASEQPRSDLGHGSLWLNNNDCSQINEDRDLTVIELIEKYGYGGETHRVTTDDGYILEMQRITGPTPNSNPAGKPVIFLMHGLMASSADWVIAGPGKGLGYLLADDGYDVWMGNARGSRYSREHESLSVENKDYWLFSWHEIGTTDLPAMIDYVLKETQSEKIFYGGHSQGTTAFFVMTSSLPKYNKKITAMFAYSPMAFASNMKSPFFRILSKLNNFPVGAMDLLGQYEFKPTSKFLTELMSVICDPTSWTQPACENAMFLMTGLGADQMNKTLLPVILGHVPAGAATRQLLHYTQLVKSGAFRQFDHGFIDNLKKYGRPTPPAYDLSKVSALVVLHYCDNDWLSSVKDVEKLDSRLPNVYAKLKVPHELFSYVDYVWGIDAKTLVYDKTMALMRRILAN